MKRILSAIVFLPAFWCIVKVFSPVVYQVLILAAALLALRELYRVAEAGGQRCHRVLGGIVALLLIGASVLPALDARVPLAIGLLLIPAAALRRGGDWGKSLGEIAATFFVAAFVGLLFGYLMELRIISEEPKGLETGSDLVFFLFLVVWGSDTAAYYVGSTLGRRPLAPRVSPRKTVEGAIAGVAGALVAAFVARLWFMYRLTVTDCLALGLGLGLIGILGDLVESMLKRGAGIKDSAALVPGHGGILDRVDSLLYAAPVLYYYYLFAMRVH